LVFGFRIDPRHDLQEFIGQLGTGSQASFHAAGQLGDAVGTTQAKPGGVLAERVFAVAAAKPASDGASDVGISAMGQCRSIQAIVFRHRTEDGFGSASGKSNGIMGCRTGSDPAKAPRRFRRGVRRHPVPGRVHGRAGDHDHYPPPFRFRGAPAPGLASPSFRIASEVIKATSMTSQPPGWRRSRSAGYPRPPRRGVAL
jgi:hypothetical protein